MKAQYQMIFCTTENQKSQYNSQKSRGRHPFACLLVLHRNPTTTIRFFSAASEYIYIPAKHITKYAHFMVLRSRSFKVRQCTGCVLCGGERRVYVVCVHSQLLRCNMSCACSPSPTPPFSFSSRRDPDRALPSSVCISSLPAALESPHNQIRNPSRKTLSCQQQHLRYCMSPAQVPGSDMPI
jgi:hypothetical protein